MTDNDNSLLTARICDAFNSARQRNAPSFVGFLNEMEIAFVLEHIKSSSFVAQFSKTEKYCFFGGYENAERKIFCAMPNWAEDQSDICFPITVLHIKHNPKYELKHSDYLGSIMAQGIVRSKIGDIIVNDNGAYIFVHNDVVKYIISQIDKIGRVGVNIEIAESAEINVDSVYKDISVTIASSRLDCIVGALVGTSRSTAVKLIASRLVFVNSVECSDVDKRISNGDTITIRKNGKFIIDSVSGLTKKGRTVMIARKKI